MPVVKRKSKEGKILWCVRRVVGGKRTFKSFGSGPGARQAAEKFEAGLVSHERSTRLGLPEVHTIQEAIEASRATILARLTSPLDRGRTSFRMAYLASQYGHLDLSSVTRSLAYDLQTRLDKKPGTINLYVSLLSRVVSLAVDRGWIPGNPIQGVKRLRVVSARAIDREIPAGDLAWILESLEPLWLREMAWAFVLTGLRDEELCGLRWDDVGSDRLVIREYPGHRLKTSASVREVPLPACLMPLVERHRLECHQVPFGDQQGGRVDSRVLSRLWYRMMRARGWKYRLHDLRHTFACRLAAANVNPVAAQKVLGHEDIKTTMIYYRMTDEAILEQVRGAIQVPAECQSGAS